VDALLMSLVKSRQIDAAKLAKLQRLIDEGERTEEEHGRD